MPTSNRSRNRSRQVVLVSKAKVRQLRTNRIQIVRKNSASFQDAKSSAHNNLGAGARFTFELRFVRARWPRHNKKD
jgi:hypothetical protein